MNRAFILTTTVLVLCMFFITSTGEIRCSLRNKQACLSGRKRAQLDEEQRAFLGYPYAKPIKDDEESEDSNGMRAQLSGKQPPFFGYPYARSIEGSEESEDSYEKRLQEPALAPQLNGKRPGLGKVLLPDGRSVEDKSDPSDREEMPDLKSEDTPYRDEKLDRLLSRLLLEVLEKEEQ